MFGKPHNYINMIMSITGKLTKLKTWKCCTYHLNVSETMRAGADIY